MGYGGILILPQKVFEGEFIHVMAYAENINFTTYSCPRDVVKFLFVA